MSLNIGILIIGSLLWDKDRQAWRDARLDMNHSELVSVPIRYGRRSGKRRGYTYTMVFSRSAPPGQARVVRCSHQVNSADDLITEALHLWDAEAVTQNSNRLARTWGCAAVLCNPERRTPEDLLKAWAARVEQETDYGNISQLRDEGCLITKGGLLRIGWPRLVDGGTAVDMDLLLATANDPTLTGDPSSYPSAAAIGNAWNAAGQEYANYFWNNIDNGITTFQDDQIREYLDAPDRP